MDKFYYKLVCFDENCKHAVRIADMKCPEHGCNFMLTVPKQGQKKWWKLWK